MNDYVYAYDHLRKCVCRFVSEYQRDLWMKQVDPEYAEERQPVDASHILVRRVKTWVPTEQGFDVDGIE